MAKSSQKKRSKFYLAEDIRLDQLNKPIIIGLYPQDKVIITLPPEMSDIPADTGVMIPTLSILVNLVGFDKSFETNISLYMPNGTPIFENNKLGEHEINNDNIYKDINIIAKFSPFRVLALGLYKFIVKIEGSSFEYEFLIET